MGKERGGESYFSLACTREGYKGRVEKRPYNLQDCEEGATESRLITTLANYTYD